MRHKIRKRPHSAAFKFKVALETIKAQRTAAELCHEFGIVSSQLYEWRKKLIDKGKIHFENPDQQQLPYEQHIEKLMATIGRLKVENDFLSKSLGSNL
ncbi:MAG: transposase [Roseivirga sp.]